MNPSFERREGPDVGRRCTENEIDNAGGCGRPRSLGCSLKGLQERHRAEGELHMQNEHAVEVPGYWAARPRYPMVLEIMRPRFVSHEVSGGPRVTQIEETL